MMVTYADKALKGATALFNRVITKFSHIEKRPRRFGTGDSLTRSEIHFIEYVGEKPLSTVTELAASLGVTKGAVSQMHGKLESKGYVRKLKRVDNDKEILLALTEKGVTAKAGHDQYHEDVLTPRLTGLTEEDLRVFVDILSRIESFADEYLKEA